MAYTGLGTTFSISATRPATYDEAGFTDAGVVYTAIPGLLSNGSTLGGTWGSTSDTILQTGEVVTSKTSKSATEFSVSHFSDETNAGITLLQAAFESRDYYTFKLVNAAGDSLYFEGHVTAQNEAGSDTESHERIEYTIMPRALGAVKVAAA